MKTNIYQQMEGNNKPSFYFSFKTLFRTNENIQLLKKSIMEPNLNMTIGIMNSKIVENYPSIYKSLVSYNAGNSWINKKISNKLELDKNDELMIENIKTALSIIKPLNDPINLFHGFEKFTNYRDELWSLNQTIKFDHVLSKTTYFPVASAFSRGYSEYSILGRFYRKYLYVKYPKNSKHICLDVRSNYGEEFEYLSAFEKLKLIDIIFGINFFPFRINKFYVMESS